MSLEKALWKAQEEALANMKLQILMAERVFLETCYPENPNQEEIIERIEKVQQLIINFPRWIEGNQNA